MFQSKMDMEMWVLRVAEYNGSSRRDIIWLNCFRESSCSNWITKDGIVGVLSVVGHLAHQFSQSQILSRWGISEAIHSW
jgi:hypothetical protein